MQKTKNKLHIVRSTLLDYCIRNHSWLLPLAAATIVSLQIYANERRVNIQNVLYEPKANILKCMISIEGKAKEALDKTKEIESGCYAEFEINFYALENVFYLFGKKLEKMSLFEDTIEKCADDDSLDECARVAQSGMFSCRNYFTASNLEPNLKIRLPYYKDNNEVLKQFYKDIRHKRDECLSLNDSIEKRILKDRFWYIF